MKKFSFVAATLFAGALCHFFCQRYLSVSSAAPDVLLLLTAANGFACGPVMGQLLGFSWGIIADATGTELFGISAFTLALVGFLAGALRRRVASERVTAQLVIGGVATVAQALVTRTLLSAFESAGRGSLFEFIVEIGLNVVFVPWVFLATERWLDIWSVEREHV
jgi:rod shape-determining protein MreD